MLRKVLPAVVLGVFACACQAIFGDFTVEPPPAEEPAPILGTECEPDEYRCSEAVLERCGDDRRGFVPVETCASPDECNLNAKACRPCMTGEFMCRGAALERCENSTWADDDVCETAALCRVDPDLMGGECLMPNCVAGAYECEGPRLMRCSEKRDGSKDFVALCESPELCDVAHADELVASGLPAACERAECAAGAFSCEGATLRRCTPDGKGWTDQATCDSSHLCSAARGTCAACTPDEIECNGAELRRCTGSAGWETLETCENAALCNEAEGECRETECNEPGALRCGDTPDLEICSDDLVWQRFKRCATAELCSVPARGCLTPACLLGETRCRGGRFERCSGDRTRWVVEATCAGGQMCDAATGCTAQSCLDGVHCNGSSLERCVAGRVEVIQRCTTASLCVQADEICNDPRCDAGEFACRNGDIVTECSPGRDAFSDALSCINANFRICDDGSGTGLAECDHCVPGAYACDDLELTRCSADGHTQQPVQGCPTACSVNADGSPVCE